MEDRAETAALAAVESLTGWWTLAGVDAAVGDETVAIEVSQVVGRQHRPRAHNHDG